MAKSMVKMFLKTVSHSGLLAVLACLLLFLDTAHGEKRDRSIWAILVSPLVGDINNKVPYSSSRWCEGGKPGPVSQTTLKDVFLFGFCISFIKNSSRVYGHPRFLCREGLQTCVGKLYSGSFLEVEFVGVATPHFSAPEKLLFE